MTDFYSILIAITMLLMNAFFVAAEFAMVKLRHTRVEAISRTHGYRGRILSYVHRHLDAYLSACQLGITLASLGLGWVGESLFQHLLAPFFSLFQIATKEVMEVISFMVAFALLSFLHIVIGELMPKTLAIRQSEKVSIWTAVPLYLFFWIMYPAIWFLNTCSNFLLRVIGLGRTHQGEYFYSTDEIKIILGASHLHGELTKDEADMLEQTLDFADLKVTDVMRPRPEMKALNIHQPISETLKQVAETRYSRYPVYDKNIDDVIGVVHVKDLFAVLQKDKTVNNLESVIRPVLKLSSYTSAIDLLRSFREGMPHFALIYRSGSILGFVTLDNLLHVLIGRIKDEFHLTQDDWIENPDGTLFVKGDCPIASLERALDREIEMSEEEQSEILTGLILNKLQSVPVEGQKIEFKEFTAEIISMRGPRLTKVKIYPVRAT